MGYKSDSELNIPDALGKKLLINYAESVSGSTDNRGSSLLAASTDWLHTLQRAWQSAEPVAGDQPSLAWDYAARTLTVSGDDFTVEMAWVNPTDGSSGTTQVILKSGVHNLGAARQNLWVRLTPGAKLSITADLADILGSPNDDGRVLGFTSMNLAATHFATIADPYNSQSTSAEDTTQYVPLFKVAGTSLSLFGQRWSIRNGHTWKLLDRDTQYVQVEDTTISITATTGSMTLTGQDDSLLSFGSSSDINLGTLGTVTLGAGSSIDLGGNGEINLDTDWVISGAEDGSFSFLADMDFGVDTGVLSTFDRGIEFRDTEITLHESISGRELNLMARNGADLNLIVESGGTFQATLRNSAIDFFGPTSLTQADSAPLDLITLANSSAINIYTTQHTSPILLQVNDSNSPITLESLAAFGSSSYVHLKSADAVLVSRLSGGSYIPFAGSALTVMDDSDDANASNANIYIHNRASSDAANAREVAVNLGGETSSNVQFLQSQLRARHWGTSADQKTEVSLLVNTGSGLREAFTIEADERYVLGERTFLLDTNAVLDDTAVDPLYVDLSGPDVDWGRVQFTVRENIHANDEMVSISIDNMDDDALAWGTEFRKTGLALRAFDGVGTYTQLLLRAQNYQGNNDTDTEGFVSMWDFTTETVVDVMRFHSLGPEVPSGMVLNILGDVDGNGGVVKFLSGIRVDEIYPFIGGSLAIKAETTFDEEVTFKDETTFESINNIGGLARVVLPTNFLHINEGAVHLYESNLQTRYTYGLYAQNTPTAMAIIDVDTQGSGTDPDVTFWEVSGPRTFKNGVDSLDYDLGSAGEVNVIFSFDADAASASSSTQPSQFATAWIIWKSDPIGYLVEMVNHQQVNAGVDNKYRADFLIRETGTGNILNLNTAASKIFRIVVMGYNPYWS